MRCVVRLTAVLGCLLFANSPACGESVSLHLSFGCESDFTMVLSQQGPGDGGIARYSIDLVGLEQADAFVQVVLRSGEPVAGFTIGGEDLDGDGTLFASQDVDDRGSILWGLGTPGAMRVAAGTFVPGVDLREFVRSASVDVFTRRGVRETVSADVEVGISGPVCIGGDFNGNGLVEQADLDLVLGNWGASADNLPPTWVNDLATGFVDQSELDKVLVHWGGNPAGLAAAGAVPEPSSIALLLVLVGLGLAACLARTR